ncbi:putative bifunctional diguanylate cyclase/phosphodiesterase [Novosphingobium resinovorum]|uniref:putative bifunctional diguanylate cyclase/phosphodiesterase n=1 Tax=Novosphingobium resinovorum TaxID=158500 RepID=UPI002ED0706C|nr:EAL domain-containing protein [Novosphingobium resinovorum]
MIVAAQSWVTPAQAQVVRLRSDVCYATAPAAFEPSAATVSRLRYDCTSAPRYESYRRGWVWLKLRDPRKLGALPAGWQIMTDQARFGRMATVVTDTEGAAWTRQIAPGAIGDRWALGGMLRFTVEHPGAHVRDVYVGFKRLDHLSLMRKLNATSPQSALWLQGLWLGLMGIFAGAILSAFAYNLLIYTGQRLVFQRWYLVWSMLALAYGLTWTNVAAFALPEYAGPIAVKADYVLVAGLIAAGNMFFLAVIEEGLLPRWLNRCGSALACLNMAAGLCAAFLPIAPPLTIDRWLNVVFVMSAICVGTGIALALRARSRVVWFYLAGWTPVLCVFALRVARNFGVLVQDDVIDMATFGALAFESVALSLAIADRFRLLGQERDAAEQARKVIEVESETFRRAAQTDYLTGLGNRAAFHTTLRTMCDAGPTAPFLLLLIDVDHLKDINDRLGHDGGDLLLGKVGRGLAAAGGPQAHVARIGGDEFAILLPWDAADELRMRRALDDLQGSTLTHAGRSWALSLSIGLARYPHDAACSDVLVKNADLALYAAKQQGRRRLHDFAPPLREKLDNRELFGQEARQGIERREFSLHYQPIVDIETGQVGSYEALLRWQHPQRGMMTPAAFGDMLNERKLGLAIQQQVLEMGLETLRDHPDRVPRLALNLIAAQLDGPHSAARMLARMRDFGVAPERLCIEVTEDFVLGRTIDETAKALGLLHEAGVTVALDDFGTGYASLIHLKHLPFDMLKIDRSFTLSLFDDDGQSEAIIRAIVGLGQALGKQVVAEGVETEAQRRKLADMGCRLGQGYLFARPAPIEAVAGTQARDTAHCAA